MDEFFKALGELVEMILQAIWAITLELLSLGKELGNNLIQWTGLDPWIHQTGIAITATTLCVLLGITLVYFWKRHHGTTTEISSKSKWAIGLALFVGVYLTFLGCWGILLPILVIAILMSLFLKGTSPNKS